VERPDGRRRSQRAFDIIGGGVLVLMGLYMLNAYFFVIPKLVGLSSEPPSSEARRYG
jgi:hypothetical protein